MTETDTERQKSAGTAEPLLQQELVLRAYTMLHVLAEQGSLAAPAAGQSTAGVGLGGKLVVAVGLGSQGAALALGATLAGAAFLGIDAKPGSVKQALRAGCCDFMVNHLDEALRVLKNEVRKHKPVSVGLVGNAAEVLPAMVERGVLPDVLADTTMLESYIAPREADAAAAWRVQASALHALREAGAVLVDVDGGGSAPELATVHVDGLVTAWSAARGWRMVSWVVAPPTPPAIRLLDSVGMAQLAQSDSLRRAWGELGPKYFRRDATPRRVMWMSDEEMSLLAAAFADGAKQIGLDAVARVQ